MKWCNFCRFCIFVSGLLMVISCASIRPMDDVAIDLYNLSEDLESFKSFQYFISRDVTLTAIERDIKTDVRGGQAFLGTKKHSDVLQLLASIQGQCLEYSRESGYLKLGIEFEQGSNNLLWFYYASDGYFYLDYDDNQELEYAGKTYKVTYEEGKGIGATLKRLTTRQKTEKGDKYQNMQPLLLYEENAKHEETESRRTLGGSKL